MTQTPTRFDTRNANIPQALKGLNQWACWITGTRDKMPADLDGKLMKWGTPSNWLGFSQVTNAPKIGIILERENNTIPIDCDGCRNKETGEIHPLVLRWLQEAHTYAEISPSLTGIKMYLRGTLPSEIKEIDETNVPWRTSPDQEHVGIEIYGQRHFLTITGNIVPGCPSEVNEAPTVLNELLARFAPPPKIRKSKADIPISGHWDYDAWVRRYCDVVEVLEDGYIITCPWAYEHSTPGDTARLWEGPPHTFSCFHAHCKGRTWQDVRTYYEPDAYTRYQEYKPDSGAVSNGNGNGHQIEGNTSETPNSFNLTDYGNAERLVANYGDELRYCHQMNSWLVWNGPRWLADTEGQAERRAKKTIRAIYKEAAQVPVDDKEGKAKAAALASHAIRSESKRALKDMLTLAQSEERIIITREALDTDPWLLNCTNGTIDLHTGELRKHCREDYITRCITTRFRPNAPRPLWESVLQKIFNGNTELIAFVKRALGYALTGDTSEQCFFLLHGTGHNGKSTLLEAVQSVLEDYAQAAEFKAFLARDNEGIRNDIARMNGKRMVIAKESDKGRRFAEALIKQLTGGDTITARFLHQEYFDFRPQFKLFLAVNHKPEIKGTDLGIWRRVRLIPFEVTIPEAEKDKDLPKKLAQEAEGILAWLVEGCLEWQRDGLGIPDAVRTATDSYRTEMDVISRFFSECCKPEGEKVGSSDLLEAYKNWCEDNGERYDAKPLRQVLLERGYQSKRGTGGRYVWHGFSLRPSEPSAEESEPTPSQSEHKSEPSEPSEPKNGNFYAKADNSQKLQKNGSLGSLGSLPDVEVEYL